MSGDGGTEPADNPAGEDVNDQVVIAVQVKYQADGEDDCPHHEARDAPGGVRTKFDVHIKQYSSSR